MACEDYPCCGHEAGDCPKIDRKGRQRWTCVGCGKTLPIKATSSICSRCLKNESFMNDDRDSYSDY